jgi:hypothetical protein
LRQNGWSDLADGVGNMASLISSQINATCQLTISIDRGDMGGIGIAFPRLDFQFIKRLLKAGLLGLPGSYGVKPPISFLLGLKPLGLGERSHASFSPITGCGTGSVWLATGPSEHGQAYSQQDPVHVSLLIFIRR